MAVIAKLVITSQQGPASDAWAGARMGRTLARTSWCACIWSIFTIHNSSILRWADRYGTPCTYCTYCQHYCQVQFQVARGDCPDKSTKFATATTRRLPELCGPKGTCGTGQEAVSIRAVEAESREEEEAASDTTLTLNQPRHGRGEQGNNLVQSIQKQSSLLSSQGQPGGCNT